jgi:hypothetical protein
LVLRHARFALAAWLSLQVVACGGCAGDAGGGDAGAGGGGASHGSGGGGSDGGSPAGDCWASAADGWSSVEVVDLSTLAGDGPGQPMLSPDGLTLHYNARSSSTAPARIYGARRADRSEAFAGGEPLALWPGLDPVGNPWVAEHQLFLDFNGGSGDFQLAVSVFDGDAWQPPTTLGPQINDGINNANAAATEDGLVLVFHRALGMLHFRIFEARRSPGDSAFEAPSEMSFPGIEPTAVTLCPTLSPDGLRLFFSTSHPHDVEMLPPNGLTVWYTERPSLDGSWSAPEPVTALDSETQLSCVMGIAGDGCELWVQHFTLSVGNARYLVGKREPR